MKKDKLLHELFLLTIALDDYSKGVGRDYWYSHEHYLKFGFCWYFKHTFGEIDIYEYFKILLPVLYKMKPDGCSETWFYNGDLEPRINCLQKAIASINEQLEKNKNKTIT